MSTNTENTLETTVVEHTVADSVYASLFEKINLEPVASLSDLDSFQDNNALAEVTVNERMTAAVQVFLERLKDSGQTVERLDKTLLDYHIAELDQQISKQLDPALFTKHQNSAVFC